MIEIEKLKLELLKFGDFWWNEIFSKQSFKLQFLFKKMF